MSIRNLLKENTRVATALTVAVLLVALWIISRQLSASGSQLRDAKWMYDLNTRQLVVAARSTPSPTDQGNGVWAYAGMSEAGSVVDAVVYTCGDPSDVTPGMKPDGLAEVGAHIGYLSRWPDTLLQQTSEGADLSTAEAPPLISDVNAQNWAPSRSRAASRILDLISSLCGDDIPRPVRP